MQQLRNISLFTNCLLFFLILNNFNNEQRIFVSCTVNHYAIMHDANVFIVLYSAVMCYIQYWHLQHLEDSFPLIYSSATFRLIPFRLIPFPNPNPIPNPNPRLGAMGLGKMGGHLIYCCGIIRLGFEVVAVFLMTDQKNLF